MESVRTIIENALGQKIFSGAQILVAQNEEIRYQAAFGKERFDEQSKPIETRSLFDLASLTKPLATATAAAKLVNDQALSLDDKAYRFLPLLDDGEKRKITIRHLLDHTAGFAAVKRFYEIAGETDTPRERVFELAQKETLLNAPGEKALYSDIDFMLLAQLIEKVTKKRLDHFVEEEIYKPLGILPLFYLPTDEDHQGKIEGRAIAATRVRENGIATQGVVDDGNCRFMGGVSGHAGLFGNAKAVWQGLELWRLALLGRSPLLSKETAQQFVFPFAVPAGSSFVLGFDRPTWKKSLAGRYISPHSIGHLGFTGTSAWLDFDKGLSVVFLTNRVHAGKEDMRIQAIRKAVHNTIYETLGLVHSGPFQKPPMAKATKSIHLIAVAGTGMGSLAGMLKEAGYEVRGSDQAIYPPMSDFLKDKGIETKMPYAPENLTPPPDLVVIGNANSRDHVEVVATRRQSLAYDSFPGVLERFFLKEKKPLVVSGTHGKTTTSSMLAWALEQAGLDPGFMIGGLVKNFGKNFKLSKGDYFVVEGDEYDSAYFDKNPKFLHYRPFGAIMTSIEFDHADIYDSLEEIVSQFERFSSIIAEDGVLVACGDYREVVLAARAAKCRVVFYGEGEAADWRATDIQVEAGVTRFNAVKQGERKAAITLPMTGRHNILNALSVTALVEELQLDTAKLVEGFQSFEGIARRQEVKGVANGVRVIDDFAHHPTAARLTLEGLRQAYPEGKMITAFDPRTNTSSRAFFQTEFAQALALADKVAIGNPSRMDRIPKEERLDVEKLAKAISERGVEALHVPDIDEMAKMLVAWANPGDTIAVLSNGGFGGLHGKLLARLREKEKSAT